MTQNGDEGKGYRRCTPRRPSRDKAADRLPGDYAPSCRRRGNVGGFFCPPHGAKAPRRWGRGKGERADTFPTFPRPPQTMNSTLAWAWTRCRHEGLMIIKEREGEKKLTASIHSEDPARVLAPAPTADISAPGPAPGPLVVAGIVALPHPSFARTGRGDRGLAPY
jgi:hypothetical protein